VRLDNGPLPVFGTGEFVYNRLVVRADTGADEIDLIKGRLHDKENFLKRSAGRVEGPAAGFVNKPHREVVQVRRTTRGI